ncbi:hypothetical protein FQN54_006924 [Arachnomyces sp. PD_36]|nr:hypothetical protein FQN54_006924 [Arachnomyces sp. PD_36]
MPLTSDISLNSTKFHPDSVSDETNKLNAYITNLLDGAPHWKDVGAPKFREMVEAGETPFPQPVYLPEAKDATIPSRDKGRDVPLRVYKPDNGEPSRGVFLHAHGGGFILVSHRHSDWVLKFLANKCQMTVISVGYRLAPEDPFPAGINDCVDAAEYLVDHAEEEYGSKLAIIGGDSAGGNLSALTALQLMRSRPAHQLAGLVLEYGYYDLTLNLPGPSQFTKPLVLTLQDLQGMNELYTPGMSLVDRRNPLMSPLYEDLRALAASVPSKSLPSALFLCGTEDALLDDSVMMSVKWMMASGEAVLKVYPGAPHGFLTIPGFAVAEEAKADIVQYIQEKLESAV